MLLFFSGRCCSSPTFYDVQVASRLLLHSCTCSYPILVSQPQGLKGQLQKTNFPDLQTLNPTHGKENLRLNSKHSKPRRHVPDARTPLLAIQMGPTGTCSLLALSYDEIPGMWVVVVQVFGKPLNPKHGIIGYLDPCCRG